MSEGSEMSLKKKAKMVQCPFCKGFGTLPQPSIKKCLFCDGHGRLEMVRLEDAQKEIDKREKDQNDAYEQLLKLFLKLGNEHSEFKQKLQCWYKQEAWFHLPLEVREHFWELLKEKEVKTT